MRTHQTTLLIIATIMVACGCSGCLWQQNTNRDQIFSIANQHRSPSSSQIAEAAYSAGKAAFAAGNVQAAVQCYHEVFDTGGFIATHQDFLHDVLATGEPGMQELIKFRDAAETKIELGKPERSDIERWQRFNEALNTKSDTLQFYQRMAGHDASKTAPRLIALWTIVGRLNKLGDTTAALPYAKIFADEYSEITNSPDRRNELSAAGFPSWAQRKAARTCIDTALTLNKPALARRLIHDALSSGKPVDAYVTIEELAKKHVGLSSLMEQLVGQLPIHDQLELVAARCLADADPQHLISEGCSKDEYAPEAAALVPKLHRGITEAEVNGALQQIWRDKFGTVSYHFQDGTRSAPRLTPGYQPPDLGPAAACVLKMIQPLLKKLPN